MTSLGGASGFHIQAILKILIQMAAFFAISIIGGVGIKKFFEWLSTYKNPEIERHRRRVPVFALAFCLALAFLAEVFGIADITGAYLAGIILCRLPERFYIYNKIEVLSYMLITPVFFASIGLKVDGKAVASMGILIVVYAMPKFADKEQKIVENKLATTFGYGALALILVPFVCLLLFCTILVILHSIVLLYVYLFIIMQVATPLVAIAMAKIICQKINKNTKGFTLLFSMLLVLAIWVLELIPVLGSIVSLLTAMLGLGIIVYAVFHSTIEPKKDSKKDDKIVAEASAIIETNGKDEENK